MAKDDEEISGMKQLSFDFPDYLLIRKTGYWYGKFDASHKLKPGQDIWVTARNWQTPLSGMENEGGIPCIVAEMSGPMVVDDSNNRVIYGKIVVNE